MEIPPFHRMEKQRNLHGHELRHRRRCWAPGGPGVTSVGARPSVLRTTGAHQTRGPGERTASGMSTADDPLTGRFEEHRPHLRAVARRMLGSTAEAEDAVQEAWLRLQR